MYFYPCKDTNIYPRPKYLKSVIVDHSWPLNLHSAACRTIFFNVFMVLSPWWVEYNFAPEFKLRENIYKA